MTGSKSEPWRRNKPICIGRHTSPGCWNLHAESDSYNSVSTPVHTVLRGTPPLPPRSAAVVVAFICPGDRPGPTRGVVRRGVSGVAGCVTPPPSNYFGWNHSGCQPARYWSCETSNSCWRPRLGLSHSVFEAKRRPTFLVSLPQEWAGCRVST